MAEVVEAVVAVVVGESSGAVRMWIWNIDVDSIE
jgi:hypothetical protein